jgi:N-sulfoglucosamine sulfohydrolase
MAYPMRVIETRDFRLIHNINYKMPYPIASDLAESPTFQSILRNVSRHEPVIWYRKLHNYYYRPQWELYDHRSDPRELVNVANETSYAKVLTDLKTRLYTWLNETSDFWICSPGGVLVLDKPKPSSFVNQVQPWCMDMYNDIGLPVW